MFRSCSVFELPRHLANDTINNDRPEWYSKSFNLLTRVIACVNYRNNI
jgi:hypothetical protein